LLKNHNSENFFFPIFTHVILAKVSFYSNTKQVQIVIDVLLFLKTESIHHLLQHGIFRKMPARKFRHGSSTLSFWGHPRCIMLGLE